MYDESKPMKNCCSCYFYVIMRVSAYGRKCKQIQSHKNNEKAVFLLVLWNY